MVTFLTPYRVRKYSQISQAIKRGKKTDSQYRSLERNIIQLERIAIADFTCLKKGKEVVDFEVENALYRYKNEYSEISEALKGKKPRTI